MKKYYKCQLGNKDISPFPSFPSSTAIVTPSSNSSGPMFFMLIPRVGLHSGRNFLPSMLRTRLVFPTLCSPRTKSWSRLILVFPSLRALRYSSTNFGPRRLIAAGSTSEWNEVKKNDYDEKKEEFDAHLQSLCHLLIYHPMK